MEIICPPKVSVIAEFGVKLDPLAVIVVPDGSLYKLSNNDGEE